jgi:DNA-binding PadR family transcriptional regulator
MSDRTPAPRGSADPGSSGRGLSALGHALLGLLHEQPRSGYDLCQLFATTPMARFSSSPGAIYPALKQLDTRRLIVGTRERAASLRPRQVYRPTPAGLAALTAWVSKPVTRDEVIFEADLLMLRFVFMDGLVRPAVARRFLETLSGLVDAYVRELEAFLPTVRANSRRHGALALEHGVERHRLLAEWARRALNPFKAPRRSPRKTTRTARSRTT